jgi:hypothetical protein
LVADTARMSAESAVRLITSKIRTLRNGSQ